MRTKAAIGSAVAVNIVVAVITVVLWVRDSAQTATSIIQTLILGDTLWVIWLYTRATFTLATTAEDQMKFVKAQFVDTKVGELIRSKPIVVTDRNADGETLISNMGDAFATNVWYLADGSQALVPLGSLGEGQTRVFPMDVADRHVLIAEARQMPPGVARKFTPTLNVWTGHAFAHGFIQRSKAALEHRGSLADYLKESPDLLEKLAAYDPLSHDPDHEVTPKLVCAARRWRTEEPALGASGFPEQRGGFEMTRNRSITLGVFLLVVVLGIMAFTYWWVPRHYTAPHGAGEFGDMFGVANAVFSGVALIGVVFAVVLQTLELKNQIREMEKTTGELAKQTSLLRSQLGFDAWLKAQEIFTDRRFMRERGLIFARLKEPGNQWTPEQTAAAPHVCRKMDALARLIPALDRKLAIDTWDDPFAKAWYLLKDVVEEERKATGWGQKWAAFQQIGIEAQGKLTKEGRTFDGSKPSIDEL